MMARAKRSLSSLLDDEQPSQEQSADDATVTEKQPVEERAETSLAIVPQPAEPVAIAEPVVASDSTTGAAAEVTAAPQAAPAATASATASAPTPSQRSARSSDSPASSPAKSRTAAVRQIKAAPEPEPELDRLPLYLELTRKEARFRQDQLNALTTLTRQLNRRRASTGERITDNTLIRVAVDMMLEVAESLDGATEADLLAAVRSRLK